MVISAGRRRALQLTVKYLLPLAVVLAGLQFKSCYDARVVEKAAAVAQVKRLEQSGDSLRALLKPTAARVIHDTTIVSAHSRSYWTARDTLRLTDTVQVKVALAEADTVVRACRDLVSSCSLAIGVRDRMISNRDSVIRALNDRFPSRTQKVLGAVKWALIGYGVGRLTK